MIPPPDPSPSTRRLPGRRAVRASRRLTGAVLASVLLVGCSLPSVEGPGGEPSAQEAPIAAEPPDPGESRVRAAVDDLVATVEAARASLSAAAAADRVDVAQREAQAALAALVRAAGSGPPPPTGPLFPDETGERGMAADADDRLTLTLTAARDAGPVGSGLLDLLRDPIAGDLGAWQRDAAGVLTSVETTIATPGGLEQLEVEVAELPGLGTRAVAWAQLAADTSDLELATAYAERGAANLEVVTLTLERFVDDLDTAADGTDAADDAADDDGDGA